MESHSQAWQKVQSRKNDFYVRGGGVASEGQEKGEAAKSEGMFLLQIIFVLEAK